ncbi:MAG: hypothetical protein ABJF23_16945 [Bryobacteraceae bacterium]
MRLLASFLLLSTLSVWANPWPALLSSVGFPPQATTLAEARSGGILILEGASPEAEAFGIHATGRQLEVRGISDRRNPKLQIIWQQAVAVPVFELPKETSIFATDRTEGVPLMAGFRTGQGAVLWLATTPGKLGFERYPYILQALADLGVKPRFRAANLWAFFDSSYRSRVDVDYFAARWRAAGISAIHVAAWHYNESDPQRDEYLKKLIEACHKQAILVYAWLELPHVSETFWNNHPQWREKTALLQDAHLDWRKLMNLNNRDCFEAVSLETRALLNRFDWDGVNLAELYFESLEGAANPSRFTPFNDDVRKAYRVAKGIDPIDLLQGTNAGGMKEFLDYRADLARKMQTQWMAEMESIRSHEKPNLDVVLTHVDDRFDPRMRDLIGADASRVLPLLEKHDFTFLIEDPATIWDLGPDRYVQIAKRYEPLTRHTEKLAIDINIVERYQDVYPTKQQTGAELFQLVHVAAQAFPRVALYFENSILAPDLKLLPSAAAVVTRYEQAEAKTTIESPRGVGLTFPGAAKVDGRLWPVTNGSTQWLPPGTHTVEPANQDPPVRLLDFNGELQTAVSWPAGMEFTYSSTARAIAIFDKTPSTVELDGSSIPFTGATLKLPSGKHKVLLTIFPPAPTVAP